MAKHLSIILNSIVFLGLTCVIIWDVWLITHTYLYDSRVTLVTWERINDSYPFLRDTRLKIAIMNRKTVFIELWKNESMRHKFNTDELEAFSARLENWEQHFNLTDTLPIQERFAVARVLSDIRVMDSYAHLGMHESEPYEDMNNNLLLRNLLQKKQYLLDLENTTWSSLRPYIISKWTDGDISHTVDSLDPNTVTVSMSLPDILSPQDRRANSIYLFNVPLLDEGSDDKEPRQPEAVVGSLSVNIRDLIPNVIDLSSSEAYTIILTITNNGIFDRTETTDCKDEAYIDLHDQLFSEMAASFKNAEPCEMRELIETVVHFCQCIPFKFRREYALVKDTITDQETLPFCTSQIYMNCTEAVSNAFTKSDKKCLPLCTQAKNQYGFLVSRETNPFAISEEDIAFSSHALLKVECNDQMYGLYTEKFQSTLQQYISQLGGDIGLYTGFSILGFGQILVFIYHICKNHTIKQDKNGPKVLTRWRNICASIFKSVIGGSDQDEDLHVLIPEIVRREISANVELHSVDMKNEMMEMQSEIATLKAEMTEIKEGMAFMRNVIVKQQQQQEKLLAMMESLTADGPTAYGKVKMTKRK